MVHMLNPKPPCTLVVVEKLDIRDGEVGIAKKFERDRAVGLRALGFRIGASGLLFGCRTWASGSA